MLKELGGVFNHFAYGMGHWALGMRREQGDKINWGQAEKPERRKLALRTSEERFIATFLPISLSPHLPHLPCPMPHLINLVPADGSFRAIRNNYTPDSSSPAGGN
ncbi:MAG: hypothetical protein RMZ69_11920 [Nostoc sp. ChiQUE01a]|nr:hypothetical protein [Nostoc sp. ChiQUE01a]